MTVVRAIHLNEKNLRLSGISRVGIGPVHAESSE